VEGVVGQAGLFLDVAHEGALDPLDHGLGRVQRLDADRVGAALAQTWLQPLKSRARMG